MRRQKIFAIFVVVLFVAAFALDNAGVAPINSDQEMILAGGAASPQVVGGLIVLVSAAGLVISFICKKGDPNAGSKIAKAMKKHHGSR